MAKDLQSLYRDWRFLAIELPLLHGLQADYLHRLSAKVSNSCIVLECFHCLRVNSPVFFVDFSSIPIFVVLHWTWLNHIVQSLLSRACMLVFRWSSDEAVTSMQANQLLISSNCFWTVSMKTNSACSNGHNLPPRRGKLVDKPHQLYVRPQYPSLLKYVDQLSYCLGAALGRRLILTTCTFRQRWETWRLQEAPWGLVQFLQQQRAETMPHQWEGKNNGVHSAAGLQVLQDFGVSSMLIFVLKEKTLSFGTICIGQECSVSIYVAQSLSRMGTVWCCNVFLPNIWRFPEIGVPPNHPFYFKIFHEINDLFGYPHSRKTP